MRKLVNWLASLSDVTLNRVRDAVFIGSLLALSLYLFSK